MKLKGISRQHDTFYVRVEVPRDVRAYLRKRELIASLRTDSPSEAARLAPPIIAGFKARIARAREEVASGQPVPVAPEDLRLKVQMALAAWSLSVISAPASREPQTPWEALEASARLDRAVNDPDGWRQVPDFDARALEALAFGGVRMTARQLAPFRQEIALAFGYAEKHRERERAIFAFKAAAEAAQATPLDVVLAPEPTAKGALPSMTLMTLFERWIAAEPPLDPKKDPGKLHHQIRRLVEFTGDIPAN